MSYSDPFANPRLATEPPKRKRGLTSEEAGISQVLRSVGSATGLDLTAQPQPAVMGGMGQEQQTFAGVKYMGARPYAQEGINAGRLFTGPTAQFGQAPPPQLVNQPGFAASILSIPGGLVNMFNGDLGKPLTDLGQFIGGVFDAPFKGIRPLGALPGGGDVTEAFAALPFSADKQAYLQAIREDPLHQEQFMLQYVRAHAADLASLQGVSRPMAQFNAPVGDLGSQLFQMAFGALSVPSALVGRTLTGMRSESDLLSGNLEHPEDTPAELLELQRRYRSGEITRDQFLDDMSQSAFRFTNDTSVTGTLLSLGIDIISDPLTYATLGMGVGIKVGQQSVAEAGRLARLVATRAGRTDLVTSIETNITERLAREAGIKGLAAPNGRFAQHQLDRGLLDELKNVAPDVYDEAMRQLPVRQREMLRLEPYTERAYQVVDRIQNPFSWFGIDRAARLFQSRMSRAVPMGFVQAYGPQRLGGLAAFFESVGAGEQYSRAFSVASANSALLMQQRSLIGDVLRSGKELSGRPKEWLTQRAEGALKTHHRSVRTEAEETVRRQMKEFTPSGVTGQAAVDAALVEVRETAAKQLAAMSGSSVDAARKQVGKMDETGLAAIHHLHYGHAIDGMVAARETAIKSAQRALNRLVAASNGTAKAAKAIAEAQSHLDNVKRYTLVSERMLDSETAKALLRALDGKGAATAAQSAIRQFDLIAANFDRKAMSPDDLVLEMKEFLQGALTGDGARLPKVLKASELEPDVRRWLETEQGITGSAAYRIALSPEDAWGLIHKTDGTLLGSSLWIDATNEFATEWRPSRLDRAKMRYMTPIRGSRLLVEARNRFTRSGVEAGLTKGQSESLFQALRGEASRMQVGPRGLSKDQIWAVAEKIDIDPLVRNRLQSRGIARMLLHAYEGDLRTVGVTTKVSGVGKTFSSRFNNFVAWMAEDLYPKMRFYGSPFFWAQEWVEGPFFNLLRGIKPGWRWSQKDLLWQELIDTMRNGAESFTDQQEFILIAMATAGEVKRTFGESTRKGKILGALPQYTNLRGVKQLNYYRMASKEAADLFFEGVTDIDPKIWNRLVDAYGTSNRRDVMLRYFADHGGLTDDSRAVLRRMDAYKPAEFGRLDRVNLSDVAVEHGLDSGASLRRAIKDTSLTESTFRSTMRTAGATDEYTDRAWATAAGWSLDEWAEGLVSALRQKGLPKEVAVMGADVMKAKVRARAKALGVTPDEYLNRKFNAMPHGLTDGETVPVDALTQTFDEQLEGQGMEVISKTKNPQRYADMQRRQREVFEPAGTGVRTARGAEIAKVQQDVVTGRLRRDGTPYGQLPQTASGRPVTLDLGGGKRVLFGDADLDDYFQFAQNVSESQMVEFSQWYDHMSTLWAGVASKLPDSTIRRIAERINSSMADPKRAIKTGQPLPNLRDEVAARLLMAFTGSQQNTSVRDGFSFVMRMLASIDGNIEVRPNIKMGLGTVNRRIEALLLDLVNLPPGGWAQKLTDFSDASSGKKTLRSLTEGVEGAMDLQPAAMDIWMKRVFGFIDREYEEYLIKRLIRVGKFTTVDDARAHIAGIMGHDPKKLPKSGAPDKWQYEAMLIKVNAIKDDWNKRGADGLGPHGTENKTDWTATDVQAVMWMSQQQAVGYAETSPNALFVTGGYSVPVEVTTPADGSMFARDFPNPATFAPEVQANVARRLNDMLAPMVADLTGAIETESMPSWGTWNGMDARNFMSVIIGGDEEVPIGALTRAYLTQQESMFATTTPAKQELDAMRSDTTRDRYWAVDFDLDPSATQAEAPYIIQHMKSLMPPHTKDPGWSGSMTARTEEGFYTGRAVYMQKDWRGPVLAPVFDAEGNPVIVKKTGKQKTRVARNVKSANELTEAEIRALYDIPADRMKELTDGSWVFALNEAGERLYPDLDAPIPVTINHRLVRVIESNDLDFKTAHQRVQARVAKGEKHEVVWPQEYGGRHIEKMRELAARTNDPKKIAQVEDIIRRLQGGLDADGNLVRGNAHEVRDHLYSIHADPSATGPGFDFSKHRRQWELSDGRGEDRPSAYEAQRGPYYQRADGRGRTVRGAMTFDAEERGTMYIGARPDPTTVVHELWHVFARELDPSGTQALLDNYVAAANVERAATGLAPMRRQTRWTVKAEEWTAREFEKYLASGTAPTAQLQGAFNAYGSWAAGLDLGKVNPAMKGFFDRFVQVPDSEKYMFNADEQRVWGAGRQAISASEDQAHSTHYYRRGRTWVERSINHPYLGLYPASYMWGKVLPELTRFLIKKPFGLDAPLGGLVLANHVYNAFQLEVETDSEISRFLEGHPEMIRMFNLLTPGIPWDIPVNMPLWARRLNEAQQENTKRVSEGKAPKPFDATGTAQTVIENTFGLPRDIGMFGDVLGEVIAPLNAPQMQPLQ